MHVLRHNERQMYPTVRVGEGSGSLVCICETPDPTGRYGSCARCNRGILSVMLERIARSGRHSVIDEMHRVS